MCSPSPCSDESENIVLIGYDFFFRKIFSSFINLVPGEMAFVSHIFSSLADLNRRYFCCSILERGQTPSIAI